MKRLAFINCRTYSGGSGLIAMPFAFNALLKLQQAWDIDLFLANSPIQNMRHISCLECERVTYIRRLLSVST